MIEHQVGEGRKYVVGDAIDVLKQYQSEAAGIFLDDAWARPQRFQQFGVDYDTHPFDNTQDPDDDAIDTSITTTEVVDACYDALEQGGWLIADADDWLLPRMINYIQEEWGDVASTYDGGGYRKAGGVTYLTNSGEPDRSTAGMYLTTGGYSVVFAHKGETERRSSACARQTAPRQNEQYGWGSVKPIKPYREWVSGLFEPNDLLIVPCAGTAPAAIAAEIEFEEEARYVCIDNEADAYEAFERRREDELTPQQQQLG